MASTHGRVLAASQSNELREVFRQLADIDGPAGPKFTKRVLTALAARIVGRAYETVLLELCHLVRAAELAGKVGRRGFEWLFWGVEAARPAAYRAAFADRASDTKAEGATLRYPDGSFEVRFVRMPMLAAMMEFLVSFLGYRTVADAAVRLGAEDVDRQTVSSIAKDLARQLYAALRDHLPTAQAQRKFRAITEFLQQEAGDEFTGHDINDEAVLSFWLANADSDSAADFRGFRTTMLAFLRLRRLLLDSESLQALTHPLAIGTDHEAGEVEFSADAVLPPLPDDDPLELLQEQPAASVKAFNKRELAALELPLTETAGIVALHLSFLRAETFGALQNRLTQALRRDSGDLGVLIAAGPSASYADCVATLTGLLEHTRQLMQATLYMLRRRRQEDADAADLAAFAAQRKAFNAINRVGFGHSALEDSSRPAFEALADVLPPISEALAAVLNAFDGDAWRASEGIDRLLFAAAFNHLYGVRANA